MIPLETLNYWLAIGTIALQVVTVYIFVEHFFLQEKYATAYLRRFGLHVVFLVSAFAALLTLVYSEVFGFIPCGLCWMERVFLYPIVIISLLALYKLRHGVRDTAVADYGIALSGIGAVIATYHHYLQMGGSALIACPTAGEGVDCAKRVIFEFGYVTFPLMAAAVFAFIIMTLLVYRTGARS